MLITTLIFCATVYIISSINNQINYHEIKEKSQENKQSGYYEFENIKNRICMTVYYLTNSRNKIKVFRNNIYLMTIDTEQLVKELSYYIMILEGKSYPAYQMTSSYSLHYILTILLAIRYNNTIKHKDIQTQSDIDKIDFLFNIKLDLNTVKNYSQSYTDKKAIQT